MKGKGKGLTVPLLYIGTGTTSCCVSGAQDISKYDGTEDCKDLKSEKI